MGTARLAVDDMLRALRCCGALVASFFAEADVRLGDAVQGVWERWAAVGGGCPHTRVARDVWQLLREGAGPLRQ
eukprot:10099265-Lingulodinium_polyedra.AAC.1